MKKCSLLLVTALCLGLVLTACGGKDTPRPWKTTVQYSNLNDEQSRKLLDELLTTLPADDEQRKVLFDHIDQVNSILTPEELTSGFEELPITQPKYDPYDVQDRWDAANPEFPGYNCRITASSLAMNLIHTSEETTIGPPDYIMMDLVSLEADPSAIPDEEDLDKFQALYTGIETEDTKDIQVHVQHIQDNWKKRHISFDQGDVSLISVFIHDQIDGDMLFVGHTGLLFEYQDQLYFLEKLAFQEPYQLVRLESRGELSDYLMTKYDVDFNQPTAAPFIMENDHLMEGYRAVEQ